MNQKEGIICQNELYSKLAVRNQNQNCIMATVVEGSGKGSKMLIQEQKPVWTYGNGLDSLVGELSHISESGLISLGNQEIFCEKIGTEITLVICGAGHVSIPIIEFGRKTGFHVIVIEDRIRFADHARKAGADQVICDNFADGMSRIPGSPDTYFVIVTRGHSFDTDCLRMALRKQNAYIGMMGSRKRVGIVLDMLEQEGFSINLLNQVHAPIGLSIGAETPEEIAVSIIAELIQVKNQIRKISNYEKEMMRYLTGEVMEKVPKVLATIISRHGSAPREIGTKMLVLENGDIVGTIGGGCAESRIIVAARRMLRCTEDMQQRVEVDMSGEEAADAGMVCGGKIEVLLERIT